VSPSCRTVTLTFCISVIATFNFGVKSGADIVVFVIGLTTTLPIVAICYLVTDGKTVAIPSTTRVTVLAPSSIIKSYTYRPGVKVAVLAAVMESVISPLAVPVTAAFIVLALLE
jgi:hypothetical protein